MAWSMLDTSLLLKVGAEWSGLAMMREKYVANHFGTCPRVLCNGQSVLPIGMSEHLKHSRVKVYCPLCEDVYVPKKRCSDVDGAYFGCSFPHIFLQVASRLSDLPRSCTSASPERVYTENFRLQNLQEERLQVPRPEKGLDLDLLWRRQREGKERVASNDQTRRKAEPESLRQ